MANGADAEECMVVSRIRPGLKREFAFAWKSQAECAGSMGRTRARRNPNGPLCNEASKNNQSNKRFKGSDSNNMKKEPVEHKLISNPETATSDEPVEHKLISSPENAMSDEALKDKVDSDVIDDDIERLISVSEDEPKSDVVDVTSDDEQRSVFVESTIKEVESTGIVLPQAEGPVQECNALNVDAEKDKSGPPCNEAENLALKLKGEPGDGVVFLERAFDDMPVKRVTRSAVKIVKEPLERLVREEVKTEDASETDSMGDLENRKPKKIKLKRFPTMLKELLDTGLLEGLRVTYLRGIKARGAGDTGLRGIIKGSGILCSCETCCGTQVVSPNQFELHAGSGNKRPPEYIYLDNGNTLRDVLNACREAPLDSLEINIQNVIGCSIENKITFCMNCKGSIPKAGSGGTVLLCNSCMILVESLSSSAPSSVNSDRESFEGKHLVSACPITDRLGKAKAPEIYGNLLQVMPMRSPTAVSIPKLFDSGSISSSHGKRRGKLTRKDLRLHKLVFENDVLPDGTELCYFARGKKCLGGYKKGFGIFCLCCQSEVSPSQFEAHAGWASRRKPYLHIYTSNGVSLHELSIQLSKLRKLSAEENDDLCSICGDGGDLLCCDCCPRAFHTECVSLPGIPSDTWYCKYCLNMFEKEKFVERNANAVAAGRIAGIDPVEEITMRCIRIVETADADVGGCALCRGHGFSKSEFGPQTVILCDQCEKEYHVGCLKEHEMDDLKELPEGKWFCCMECKRIHYSLQTLVANGEEKLQEPLLNAIKKKLEEKGLDSGADLDIRWRLLSGKTVSVETNALFVKAVDIFHDRFDPIADSNVRHQDLIPPMVYGRSARDQDLGGMFCAILSVNSNVVSAGIIRIFGENVAEVPLVATSNECQGQGYFQALFSCMTNLLRSLNVRNLLLPAADGAESLWTNKFGFKKITEAELMKYRKDYPLMFFQGTLMLHKSLQTSP